MITLIILLSIAIISTVLRLTIGVLRFTGKLTFSLIGLILFIVFGVVGIVIFFSKLLIPFLFIAVLISALSNLKFDNDRKKEEETKKVEVEVV